MKAILSTLIIAVMIPWNAVKAQQVPLFSQYYYNQFLYNPAMAGEFGQGAAFLIHRSQYSGIQGSPLTNAFTLDGPIKSKKIALGFSAYSDQTDIFERFGASLAYAYRMQLAERSTLSLGLAIGMLDNRIDFSKVVVKDQNDVVLMSNQYQRRLAFDGSFGAHLKVRNFEIGAAIPNLIAPEVKYYDVNNTFMYYSVARHFRGMAKYTLLLTQDTLSIEPLVYAQYAPGAPVQIDAGMRLNYRDRAWLGALYRHQFAITLSAGVKLHKSVVLGYAYDWVTSDIAPYAGGTHEVMLGFTFGRNNDREERMMQDMKNMQLRLEREEKNVDSLEKKLEDHDTRIKDNNENIRDLEDNYQEIRKNMKNFSDVFPTDSGASGAGKDGVKGGAAGKPRSNVNKGDVFMLDNLYFGAENAEMLPSSYEQLNQLALYLVQNPGMKIEVAGHADQSGSAAYNQKLSKDRAEAVKFYLISQGVPKSQIKTTGYGQTKPIANNDTYEGRKRNRRVELIILDK